MTFKKSEALQAAYTKAAKLSMRLSGVYDGPLVVAGGWVRDQALGFSPKDCDVFVDGGIITNLDMAMEVSNRIAFSQVISIPPRQFSSYGSWAEDVDHITQMKEPEPIDLVVLRREAMVANGYQPDLDYASQCVTFLGAVLKRLDLRINAIGACTYGATALPGWEYDAACKRLVLQASRRDADMTREDKRLLRLLGGKFQGWSVWQEDDSPQGLSPYKPGVVDVG